jgi:hypothetical protein
MSQLTHPALGTPKPKSETQIQSEGIDLLEENGFRCERINCGRSKGFNGGILHHARKGTPDTLIVWPYGWVEFKKPGEVLSPDQVEWHAWAEAEGVPHTVAYSAYEALEFARSLRK